MCQLVHIDIGYYVTISQNLKLHAIAMYHRLFIY